MRPEKGYNRSYRQGDFPGFRSALVPRSPTDGGDFTEKPPES